jgi:hypothetical protein
LEEQARTQQRRADQLELEREALSQKHRRDREALELELDEKRQSIKKYE